VGVFLDDGLVPVSHSVARAVRRAGEVLAERGCIVEPFTPPDPATQIYGYFAALSADDGATIMRGLAGGEIDPVIQSLLNLVRVPQKLRGLGGRVASVLGEERLGRLLGGMGRKPVEEFWRLTQQFRTYRFAVLDALDAAKIDVVLSPAHATPALPHGLSRDFLVAGSHSMLWNIVQFPGGVVPVTTVRESEGHRDSAGDRLEKRAAEVDRRSPGLPVGVQVVARPWREDLVLATMKAIEESVAGDEGVPRTPIDPR
jgi:fatty acid amide hydrolase